MHLKILKFTGISLGLLLLFVFAFLTNFPLNNALETNIDHINAQISPYRITYTSAESGLSGLTFKGIEISTPKDPNQTIQFNSINIPFLSSDLLQGKVPFNVEVYKGEANGSYNHFGRKLSVFFDKISIGDSSFIRELQILNNAPQISGEVDVNLSNNNIRAVFDSGEIALNGQSPSFSLPVNILPNSIDFSQLKGEFSIENNSKINLSLGMQGDYSGEISGQMLWNNRNTASSVLNLTIKGSFSEAFATENEDILLFGSQFFSGRQANLSITGKLSEPNVRKL